MNFDQAYQYLAERPNWETTPNAGWVHGLSLDAMVELCGLLSDPQSAYPVIHVTGTNGKGSVVHMISALLDAHGLTVGTYTSPHLETVRERIRRNNELISEEDFAEIATELSELEPLLSRRPTFFEAMTGAAFSWFAREAVDVAVVEVGMLGRYDATNVVQADVAVITNIAKDHTDGADDFMASIAQEKAGIIKPSSTVVVGNVRPDLVDIFRAEGGADYLVTGEDFSITNVVPALGGQVVDLTTRYGHVDSLFVPLHGEFQATNAALAVMASEAFFSRPVDQSVADQAFRNLTAPGRIEVVGRSPLVILDGGHNVDAIHATCETVRNSFRIDGHLNVVIGSLRPGELAEIATEVSALHPRLVVCCRPDSPRSAPAHDLAEAFRAKLGPDSKVVTIDDVATATQTALSETGTTDALLVCGSFYVVGPARSTIRTNPPER